MTQLVNCCSRPTIPFAAAEYAARLGRLRRRAAAQYDALLIEEPVNRLYLTGFDASNGLLCLSMDEARPRFFTDFRYYEAARAQMTFARVEQFNRDVGRYDAISAPAGRGRWRRVGYDGGGSLAALERMKKALPEVKEWRSCQPVIDALRAIKSPAEQKVLRQAVHLGDEVLTQALRVIKPGMTEWEIRVLIRGLMDQVSQGEAFDTIVAAGANASRCHHRPSLRALRRGQGLLLDMGVKVDGYCSDMTRVVFYGKPSAKLHEIYDIVLEANRKALAGIRAGLTCHEGDWLARRVIEKAGYGQCFGHGTGHSLGLAIHEALSLRAKGKELLRPGMVVTVEPGIYLPGVGGVRIEDVVVIGRHGCEVLTRSPKNLQIL